MLAINHLYKTMVNNFTYIIFYFNLFFSFILNWMPIIIPIVLFFFISVIYFFNLGMSVSYENTKEELKEEYISCIYKLKCNIDDMKNEVKELKQFIYSIYDKEN